MREPVVGHLPVDLVGEDGRVGEAGKAGDELVDLAASA